MIKKVNLFSLFLWVFLCSNTLSAQIKSGELVDGIAAVIGDEIVLESDIKEQMAYAKQQGINITNKCEFLSSFVYNKLIIYQAKRDTLIPNRSDAIKEMANQKYNHFLSQFPDEKTMLKVYGFRTAYEMKNAIQKNDTDNYYQSEKQRKITSGIDITPNEVTDFYNTYRYQLDQVNDEVSLAQIVMYPKLNDAHKQELKDKLNKIKQDILGGESFENMARIYSEDQASAVNGGLMTNISKGAMVKPFEAAALNLQEGEISEPIESEFGFHLIQLVKKTGKKYDARHILLLGTPNKEELIAAKKELDSIRTMIVEGKITFKEAAYKFSDDKNTKFNGGTITAQDGSDKIEKSELSPIDAYQIAGLNKGDITEVFESEGDRRKTINIILVKDIIPAHQLDINTDYERIKSLTLNKKRKEATEKWVKEQLPNIFISINKRYKDCNLADWQKEALEK